MKKVAQRSSTGGAGSGRVTGGKIVTDDKSVTGGKIVSRDRNRVTGDKNLRHRCPYNRYRNNQRTKGEGGGESNVIPFQRPAPENVVPLHPATPIGVNHCPAKGPHLEVAMLYASQAELLAKVVPCRAAETAPPHVVSCQDVGRIWLQEVIGAPWYDAHKEALVALALDTRRHCRNVFLISLGSLNETLGSPREVFRPLIVAAAHTFILCHNHPSGNPEPSDQDKALAQRMQEVGRLIEIPMLDFVIFGHPEKGGVNYYSFSENQQL